MGHQDEEPADDGGVDHNKRPLDWPDATLVSGDAVDVVAKLKAESNVPLRSHGGLSTNRALMAAALVDRVQVTLFPAITPRNGQQPIFRGGADIGWVAFAILLSFAVTHLVTNVILRDDPEQDFRRVMITIDRRINVILRDIIAAASTTAAPGSDRRSLQAQLSQLRDIVLMAEGFIPQGEVGSLAATGAASDLAVGLFELQLSVERMVRASYLARPSADLLTAVLDRDSAAMRKQVAALPEASGEEVASRLLVRVHRARERLDALLKAKPSPAFVSVPGDAKARRYPPRRRLPRLASFPSACSGRSRSPWPAPSPWASA